MKIVAICGSSRRESYNLAILKTIQNISKSKADVVIFNELDQIPIFNPDIEFSTHSDLLIKIRAELKSANALIISTPEYIHSIPGALKNLCDWLVGTAELDQLPTSIIVATSSSGAFAFDSINEITQVMNGGKNIATASVILPGIKTKFKNLELKDQSTIQKLNYLVDELIKNSRQ